MRVCSTALVVWLSAGCGRFEFDVRVDAPVIECLSIGICVPTTATDELRIDTPQLLDTDLDPRCTVATQVDGPDVCVVYAARVEIAASGMLLLVGSRPAVIVSASDVVIDGVIDASSGATRTGAGANWTSPVCSPFGQPGSDLGGSGGGAGGSFGVGGGRGGDGDSDDNMLPIGPSLGATPAAAGLATVVRGGCRGSESGATSEIGARGGSSGGAIYLATTSPTGSIVITGLAAAGGEGGQPGTHIAENGGGGGGSGGLIALEAATITIASSARVVANGGAGGEGGAGGNGVPGADATTSNAPASGGAGGANDGGDGGAGGAGNEPLGGDGALHRGGGGGGGGAVGVIRVVGAVEAAGTLSPAPT